MKITEPDQAAYWHQLAVHTAAGRPNGAAVRAPWTLQLRVAALVGNGGIEASFATFDGSGPSTWTVAILTTDSRLAVLRMQFDAENYDAELDGDGTNPVSATVIESCVRRLSDVASLGIGNARLRHNAFNHVMQDVLDMGDVSLTFSDRNAVDLGIDQVGMTRYEDRQRSDFFIDVLRQRTGL
jgi:hypothetical protein